MYSCAAPSFATVVVLAVAVPWLIVRSPASVVVRLPIVPDVELKFPIVPDVEFTDPLKVPPVIVAVDEVSVWIVPLVILAAVAVVVPRVEDVKVAAVPVAQQSRDYQAHSCLPPRCFP